jgi:hypothetical protein
MPGMMPCTWLITPPAMLCNMREIIIIITIIIIIITITIIDIANMKIRGALCRSTGYTSTEQF